MNIFVAAANGAVHTVEYAAGKLTLLKTSNGCGETPSWLYKGLVKTRFWCWDEGAVSGNGSLSRLDIQADGSLVQAVHRNYTGSPVHGGLAFDDEYLVGAVYSGMSGPGTAGGVAFDQVIDGNLTISGSLPFVAPPGPKPGQELPHAHAIATDPTNKWVVVPDLGSDRLHVFGRNGDTDIYLSPDQYLEPGTGPRHAVFYRPVDPSVVQPPTYLFVVSELANTVTTINVTYPNNTLTLSPPSRVSSTFAGSPFVNDTNVKLNAKAAEIKISPDNRFLSVSNRNVSSSAMPELNGDSITTFSINQDGSLVPVGYKIFGFGSPRAFEFNPAGDKVLVSFYKGSAIEVYERDIMSGKIGSSLATLIINTTVAGVSAGVNHAIWDYR